MNKGFSLVELIVVIAIMAILVGVAVPVYTQYITSANESVDKQTAGEVKHAIEVVLIDPSVTDTPEYNTITLTEDGLKYSNNGTAVDTEDDFLKAVKAIVPSVKVDAENDYSFAISGYTVTVTPSLAD